MEEYAAKMMLKSDAALREYVAGYAQYRDEAVLAALAELRRRGQPAPEESTLRPLLEAAVRQQQAAAALVTEPETETAEADLPQLYSPAGIAVISATVSVVAGAVLLALNMFRLKRKWAAAGLALFVVAYLIAEALTLRWLLAQHMFSLVTPFLLDLPLILAYVWWFWPRYAGTYDFRPRNWLLPLGICLLLKYGLYYLLLFNPGTAQLIRQQMQEIQQLQR